MARTSRIGSGLLLAGGAAVLALMAYTLSLGDGRFRSRSNPSIGVRDVDVFFPDRIDWRDFRLGIAECGERGLLSVEFDGDDHLLIKTPRKGRLVRFVWHRVRGRQETAQDVRRLTTSDSPPLAIVGSGNTAVTLEIAQALRDSAKGGDDADQPPVLLLPWASSVFADGPVGTSIRTPVLEIYGRRTFRFCPNNQQLADLVIGSLAASEPGKPPHRVVMVVDAHDPYSVDLAAGFAKSIRSLAPKAEIETESDPEPYPGLTDVPGLVERHWAEAVWQRAHQEAAGRITWVILPLQAEPAKRLLLALRGLARASNDVNGGPIRVLCGDAISVDVLSSLLGPRSIPVWAASPASTPAPGIGIDHDVQVHAEIVSAVVRCLDGPQDDLRTALVGLEISAGDRAAFGRSIAFALSGERRGSDLGLVFAARPGQSRVQAYTRGENGRWGSPVPVSAAIEVAR
jgi:hypothetical protein